MNFRDNRILNIMPDYLDPLTGAGFLNTDPRIRIRIHVKMKWIRNTASNIVSTMSYVNAICMRKIKQYYGKQNISNQCLLSKQQIQIIYYYFLSDSNDIGRQYTS